MRSLAMPDRRTRAGAPGCRLATALLILAAAACGKGNEQQAGATTGAAAAPAAGGSAGAAGGAQTASAGGAANGEQVFQRCATCHQPTGQGIPGTYPPLAGSEWIQASDPSTPIKIVLHGLSGPITVKGQTFTSTMPPFGTGQPMTDDEVAAVLTYERSSWGNHASAVTAQQVAQVRQATSSRTTPFTSGELKP